MQPFRTFLIEQSVGLQPSGDVVLLHGTTEANAKEILRDGGADSMLNALNNTSIPIVALRGIRIQRAL